MNYFFYVEYFQKPDGHIKDLNENDFQTRNREISNFRFKEPSPLNKLADAKGYSSFDLYTTYPGLLIGMGNMHDYSAEGAIKCGFSFDFVTGMPYIPGSSLKGMLRSYFPGSVGDCEKKQELTEYIQQMLPGKDIGILESKIFNNGDIFLGAYPIQSSGSMLEMEFITPHKSKFKNPIPINILKVKPNVGFRFSFILRESGGANSEEKTEIFKKILLDMGIGAKTNVGFGMLTEKREEEAPKCANKTCKNKVDKYPDGTWQKFCHDCRKKHMMEKKAHSNR